MSFCIYRITNNINGHTYIGQHKYSDESNPMGRYKGSGKILKLAYAKYDLENFSTEILYSRIRDKATADAMEIYAIAKYKPEYNITKGGGGGDTFSGRPKESQEITRKRISEANKGTNNYWYGKSWDNMFTPEQIVIIRKHMSEAQKKIIHTEEWNAKVAASNKAFYAAGNHNSNYGKKFTQEHSDKISESRKGYKWFNNGFKSVQAKECPDGFVPGLCEADKAKRRGHEPWNKGKKGVQVAWNKGMRKNVTIEIIEGVLQDEEK